jgi:TDG/mug DNA glycosylase family protein
MPEIAGLSAVTQPGSRLLILGSMPGVASLQQQQYYAHPRNAFWPIMARLLGFEQTLSYPQRLQALLHGKIALWDVIGHCQRQGSLDSAIRAEQANDFETFFKNHPQLMAIGFNGNKAWQSFNRLVLPQLTLNSAIALLPLPSSSPAYAALSAEQKLQQWAVVKTYLN